MHRALDEAMPDEVPTSVEGGLTCGFVDLERGPVDRETCLQAAFIQSIEKAPEANPHAILMPGPVGNVRQKRLSHRRRQNSARHRCRLRPVFDIDDGPDGDALSIRQFELRPLGYGLIWKSAANTLGIDVSHVFVPICAKSSSESLEMSIYLIEGET